MNSEHIRQKTLFVGEGDFSFAASYISSQDGLSEDIYATCFNDYYSLGQPENIQKIKSCGGIVYTDVDATKLDCHPDIRHISFDKIIFNFPHVKKKMNIRENRKLLIDFFCSARKQLKETGKIVVTLCQGQGGTDFDPVKREWSNAWQICSLAATASLILVEALPFDPEKMLNYICTGYRGLQKSFSLSGAVTHVFCPAPCAEIEVEEIEIKADVSKNYLENCKKLFLNSSRNLDGSFSPSSKIISFLNETVYENFVLLPKAVVPSLLTCSNFVPIKQVSKSQVSSDSEVASSNICTSCLKRLGEMYLQNNNCDTHVIAPIICSICCSKYFDTFKLPFYKCVAYFSSNKTALIRFSGLIVKKIKKVLNLPQNFYKEQNSQHEFCAKNSIEVPSNYVYESMTVKQIMNIDASYSLKQYNGITFYCNINVTDSTSEQETDYSSNTMEVGSIFQFESSLLSNFWCFVLNIDVIACLKFHISDPRILFFEGSYFPCTLNNTPQLIYRCKSISPPIFVHDTSFWITDEFSERNFFLLMRIITQLLIKKIVLIDSYCQDNKISKCYSFHYQSCNHALSKEKANNIHTNIVRKVLSHVLQLKLR